MENVLRKEKAISVSEEDVKAIVEFELANIVDISDSPIEEEAILNISVDDLNKNFTSKNIKIDGKIVGKIELSNRNNEYIILDRIFINKEYRGNGYADDGLNKLKSLADKSNKIITLTPDSTWGSNIEKLKKWYKSHGFVINSGKKKDFQTMQLMYRLPKSGITELANMVGEGSTNRKIYEGYFDMNEQAEVEISDLPFKNDVEQAGGKIYSVGGAVRDKILGRESKDLDLLITGVPLDQLESILKKYGKVDNVGKSFGIIKFNTPELGELDIAIPRKDSLKQGFVVKKDDSEVFIQYGGLNIEKENPTISST